MERKLILYISSSLDGFIAKQDGDLSFLSLVEKEGEDYGYEEFINNVDTVIVGRKTYDKIISMGFEFPHSDKVSYVISRSERPSIGSVQFYSGDLATLVKNLKSKKGKNIYCDGGAEIVNELLKNNLIDEIIISIIPILLGNGIRLFKERSNEQKLVLVSVKQFEKGLAQFHYQIDKSQDQPIELK